MLLRLTSLTSGNTTSPPSSDSTKRCTMPDVLQTLALSITTCSLLMAAHQTIQLSGSSSTSVRMQKEPLLSTARVRLHVEATPVSVQTPFYSKYQCNTAFAFSWPGEDRYSNRLLYDETLLPDSSRGHCLDPDLSTRVHHWAPAELC